MVRHPLPEIPRWRIGSVFCRIQSGALGRDRAQSRTAVIACARVTTENPDAPLPSTSLVPCTERDLALYFLRLGTTGFGGPVALVGAMQRDLVEQRRWISKSEYLEGLALSQLAPGPLAAQLAIYLGWVRGGVRGATVAGVAFVLPSFFMVLGLAALYVRFGSLPWMRAAFYGIGAAVIALMARSVFKLGKLGLGNDRLLWAIALASGLVTAITESEMLWVFLGGGLLALAAHGETQAPAGPALVAFVPDWLIAGVAGPASTSTLFDVAWYFAEAGAFVFGSGLAIVPFLRAGVVDHFHWLDDAQFLDAVAVAMITPGPVVITVAFIGYLAAGPLGACIAAIATFIPCWIFTVVPAPHFARLAKNEKIAAFVRGVTAAATGAIGGATYVLAGRAIVDVPTSAFALVTLAILIRWAKVSEPLVILAAGLIGLLLHSMTL